MTLGNENDTIQLDNKIDIRKLSEQKKGVFGGESNYKFKRIY